MKIAFTAKGTSWNSMIDPRFGRTEYLLLFDEEIKAISAEDNRVNAEAAHGAGTKMAKDLVESGAEILITGNGPGSKAKSVLEQAGIKIFVGAQSMKIEEALQAYYAKELAPF